VKKIGYQFIKIYVIASEASVAISLLS